MTEDVAARGLFDAPVRVGTTPPPGAFGALRHAERLALPDAGARRRGEFAAGRLLARRLIGELGLPAPALGVGPDRRPLWPAGLTGSIAHAATCCTVAVAPRTAMRALGIDVEERAPLERATWRHVLRAEERLWLRRRPAAERGALTTACFSIKEAVIKCVAEATGTPVGLLEIALSLHGSPPALAFRAEVLHPLARAHGVRTIRGRACTAGRHVLAGACLPATTRPLM